MSFNLARQLKRGKMSRLHELLKIRHHTDPDPDASARAEIQKVLDHAFGHLAHHYYGTKNAALRALVRLQREAFDFYDSVLHSQANPDVAKLEKILRDIDAEMTRLARKADDIADGAPKLDLPLSPPKPKAWDDPTLTVDEFIAQYRMQYPRSPLTERQLRKKFAKKQRLNPETGELKKPVRPLPPPQHAALPMDPARIKQWEDYQRGGEALPCFPAGTLVHVPGGLARIEDLGIGDRVLSWNERTRELDVRAVLHVHRNWTDEMVIIETSGGAARATRGHRFWSEDRRRWVAAGEIAIGTELRLASGDHVTVAALERRVSLETTYNFEVAENHTYFVAEAGMLVHNDDESAFKSRDARRVRIYRVSDRSGKVVYVGQTVHADVNNRLYEHINDPDSSLHKHMSDPASPYYVGRRKGAAPLQIDDPRCPFFIQEILSGDWTPYEAAVWEQHFIDRNGGLDNLLNRQSAITSEKFILYRNLHNPC
jgi:hypothetical protein